MASRLTVSFSGSHHDDVLSRTVDERREFSIWVGDYLTTDDEIKMTVKAWKRFSSDDDFVGNVSLVGQRITNPDQWVRLYISEDWNGGNGGKFKIETLVTGSDETSEVESVDSIRDGIKIAICKYLAK